MLAFYLNARGLSRNEVAQVLSKEPDTLRRNHYFERGLIGEVSLTFRLSSVSDPIFYPGAEPYLFEGVDRLPRVQDTEPRGQDEPRNPRVAVVDPPPPTQTIRWAFQSAHRACPHTAEIIVPGSQLKTHPLRVDVYRPSCPIADRLGIDPSPGAGLGMGRRLGLPVSELAGSEGPAIDGIAAVGHHRPPAPARARARWGTARTERKRRAGSYDPHRALRLPPP